MAVESRTESETAPVRPGGRVGAAAVRPADWSQTALVGIGVVAALYVARDIFVPIALAVLLSFVLAPLARALRRIRFGRVAAAVTAVLVAVAIIAGIGSILVTQLTSLAANLPQYQANIREKAQSLRGAAPEAMERLTQMMAGLKEEMNRPAPAEAPRAAEQPRQPAPAAASGLDRPIPVEVRQPDPEPLEFLQQMLGPFVEPVTTAGITIIFAVFILLYREDLRDRLIRLFGTYDLHRTTEAMNDAARRLSRFFLIQLGINSGFGVVIGVGLWIIGVPNPVLWGVIAMLMRFVPYVGSFIAAGFPAALAMAVDPGWSLVIWTLALFLITEPMMGQVVEPWVYGHSTGLSPIAVITAATFWLWLWGPIGLLLATPLTLCLVVLGRHVERLRFIDILLGDQPALEPDKSFYQRMLAGDPYEVAEQAERYLKEHALSVYYDEVALKGLALASLDAAEGRLDDRRLAAMRDSVHAVIEDLSDYEDEPPQAEIGGGVEPTRPAAGVPRAIRPEEMPASWASGTPVLCAPAHTALDEGAALMLQQLLEKHGLHARAASRDEVAGPGLFTLDPEGAQIVCVSYFGAAAGFARARYLVRRLRRRLPEAHIVACFWGTDPKAFSAENLAAIGAEFYVGNLRDAVALCVDLARKAELGPAEGPTLPASAIRAPVGAPAA